MKLIVLSALDTACRDAGLEHLKRHHPEAITLKYDFVEGNRLVRTVAGSAAAEHGEAVLEHPCMGCATKFEIHPAVSRLAPHHPEAKMILGLPATWHSGSILEYLIPKLVNTAIAVDSICLAMDPSDLEDQMWDRHTLWESGFNALEHDERTSGEFFFRELMQADTLIPVEGLETQLLTAPDGSRRHGGEVFETGIALAQQLAPHAEICRHEDVLGSFEPEAARDRTASGHVPAAAACPENAPIHLRGERPLHPERFRDALPSLAQSSLCIRGCLWVANALSERIAIGGAGPRVWMENTGPWDSRIAASEILLYGSEHAAEEVSDIFEQCQVTDEELQSLFNPPAMQGGE